MLSRILDETQEELLGHERRLLADVEIVLARHDLPEQERGTLAASIAQLDELFLLVVAGEFNSGKSALINALLGSAVLAEGVTPTTAAIHHIAWGESVTREPSAHGHERIGAPVELLRQVNIVDTPGTNALDRRHEAITTEFIPRADLVLFVTSADRPFSESERAFLERIREWGKKVMVVVNKVDILRSEQEIGTITRYIAEHAHRLLGITPHIAAVSSLSAQRAHAEDDAGALAASGLPELEAHLRQTLERAEVVRLKLLNPLGVAENLLGRLVDASRAELELLAEDVRTLDDIEQQVTAYAEDIDREFGFRLADMDNLLHQVENRGVQFFDDTLRLTRVFDLFDGERLQADFTRVVLADTPQQIEARADAIIDWLVESDLNQWQAVTRHVQRRRSAQADRVVGEVSGRFESNRSTLLETVGKAAREGLASYDRDSEARRMAADVQKAVAGTALVEVGAVSLGATIALVAGSTTADVTGLVAAGVLAALGLVILPNRRRRAKKELKEKILALRTLLMTTLTEQFRHEAERSQRRIRDTVAPYTRFVRSERERLTAFSDELTALVDRGRVLRARIEAATADTADKPRSSS